MKRYKVRFNLGAGKNYMKWKVYDMLCKQTYYFPPNSVVITMYGATLHNHKGTAQKIHDGANKTVCAWVECDHVQVDITDQLRLHAGGVCYNPRVTPNWTSESGENMDKEECEVLTTQGRRIYESI